MTAELANQMQIANAARIEAFQRANSQSHAEHLLHLISAFLSGWDFSRLDPECAEEAAALDASISELFAYGWPLAQYDCGAPLTRPAPPSGEQDKS